jgi:ATP-dependent RNA helicase DDX55/SPB4
VRKNGKARADFQQSVVDPDSVPYRDPIREKARQKALKKSCRVGGVDNGIAAHERPKRTDQQKVLEKKVPAAKRQLKQAREDLKELEEDYRLLRKLKKGKASNREYEQSIGLGD